MKKRTRLRPLLATNWEFIELFDRTVGGGAHDAPFPFSEQKASLTEQTRRSFEKFAHRGQIFRRAVEGAGPYNSSIN